MSSPKFWTCLNNWIAWFPVPLRPVSLNMQTKAIYGTTGYLQLPCGWAWPCQVHGCKTGSLPWDKSAPATCCSLPGCSGATGWVLPPVTCPPCYPYLLSHSNGGGAEGEGGKETKWDNELMLPCPETYAKQETLQPTHSPTQLHTHTHLHFINTVKEDSIYVVELLVVQLVIGVSADLQGCHHLLQLVAYSWW